MQKDSLQCILKDDIQKIYGKLEADVAIFGTPLYWYGPSAKMKLLIDRLRPFIESKKLKGKHALLVVPSEEGAEACSHIVGMFNLSLKYLEMNLSGVLLPMASEKAEAKSQPHMIEKAKALGRHIE